jgi:hypothetical protein
VTLRPGPEGEVPDAGYAEAEARVEGRVQAWLEDGIAAGKAENGLVHPYYAGLGDSLESRLRADRGGAALAVQQAAPFAYLKSYLDALGEYGRTGSPGIAGPSTVPTASEQLAAIMERKGNHEAYAQTKLLVQAAETRLALAQRGPLFSLKLELRQSHLGELVSVTLLERSGNEAFDTFVLKTAPEALAALAPPPPDVTRRDELRSIWQIDARLLGEPLPSALTFVPGVFGLTEELAKAVASVAVPSRMPDLEFKAKLLSAY